MKIFNISLSLILAFAIGAHAQVQSRLIGYEDSTTDIYSVLHVRSASWSKFSGNRGTTFSNSIGTGPFKTYYFITADSKSDTSFYTFDDYIAPGYHDSSMVVNNYDIHNNTILRRLYSWDANTTSWAPTNKDSFTYNSSNQLSGSYAHSFNSGSYMLNTSVTFTYNGNQPASIITQSPAGTNTTKRDYTYTSGLLSEERLSIWQSNAWVDSQKTEYSYINNLLTLQQRFIWNSSLPGWELVEEQTFSYNNNNQLLTTTRTGWTNGFKNYSVKDSNAYSGNNVLLQYHASSQTWVYDMRDSFGYDNNGNILLILQHRIDGSGNLINHEKTVTTFNSFNQPLNRKKYYWNNTAWVKAGPHSGVQYHYEQYTSVNGITPSVISIMLYPVPANSFMNLQVNAKSAGTAILTITDINGRLARQWQENIGLGELNFVIPTSDLPAGHYILHTNMLGKTFAKEFNILR